ncbi:MAG: ATP-binding protein, partial [Pedobacter sp.]
FNEMVEFVIEDLQRTTENHQIVADLKQVGLVFTDKERMSQVVTNLITNAIKYSPDAKQVIVHTTIENNDVVVCVEDFGIGIAEEKLNKVFEQFYRVSGNMRHTFPGLGLGLYISSEIIKREGGRIWVSSTEGKGSKFCFSIPLQKSNEY